MFSLPKLSPAIPSEIEWVSDTGEAVKSAEALAQAGVLRPEHWDGQAYSSVTHALAEWSRTRPTFSNVRTTFAPHINTLGLEHCQPNVPTSGIVFHTWVHYDEPYVFHIGRGLETATGGDPALMSGILHILHTSFCKSCGAFDPATALSEAIFYYWNGNADEEEYLSNLRDKYPAGPEGKAQFQAAKSEVVTRAMFDATCPPWASHPKATRLALRAPGAPLCDVFASDEADRALSSARSTVRQHKGIRDPKLLDLLQQLHHLPDARNDARYIEGSCAIAVPWFVALQNPCELMSRLFDDLAEHYGQSSLHTELGAVVLFDLDDPGSVRRGFQRADLILRHLKLQHEILTLLNDPT